MNTWECCFAARLDGWVVEKVGEEGEVFVTQFYGPLAEQRAKEYADWKNGTTGDTERGLYMLRNCTWRRDELGDYIAVYVARGSDLSCLAMRRQAIDEAIAAEKERK